MPTTMNGDRLSMTSLPNGSTPLNRRCAIVSLITATRAPFVASAGVKLRPCTMSPPVTSNQLAVYALTCAEESTRSRNFAGADVPLRIVTSCTDASRSITAASATRSGGLLRHLQLSSSSSLHASSEIGKR